jgi:hypothetical protein
MAQTVVGFTIEIDGINSINSLNAAISDTTKQMNALDLTTEEGKKEFKELSETVGKLTAQQKALKKAQDDVNKSFLEESSLGAYDKASAKLNRLRKEFKNAALDGSKSAEELDKLKKEIQQLDQTLKKADAQVGQFQRNVGNYPKTFARVTRVIYASIPGFEAFAGQLRNSEGNLNTFGKALTIGFVAFQAANLINKAITNLEEFNKKVNETRMTVMEFSGLYGESLDNVAAQTSALANTFGTDAKTISAAAKSLAQSMGISFEEAVGKLEGALVEGRGNANDYLEKIKEMPAAFVEAGAEVSELAKDNRRLLDSNRELASSQIETAKKSKDLILTFKEFKNAAGGAIINVLLALFNALSPIGKAFFELGKSVYDFISTLIGLFVPAGQSVDLFQLIGTTIQFILSPITFLINLMAGIYKAMTSIAPVLAAVSVALGVFTLAMNAGRIAAALSSAALVIYNGAVIAYTAIINTAKAAQLAFNAAVRANPLGLALTGLVAAGTAVAAYTAVTDENTDAVNENTDAQKKAEEEMKSKMQADEKAAAEKMKQQQKEFDEQSKRDEEKRKAQQQAEDDARKYTEAVKKLTDERNKFLENEVQVRKNTLALIAELQARYIEENIKNIKDDRERQLKEIQLNGEKQLKTLDEQFAKFQDENKKRLAEGQKQLQEAIKLALNPKEIQKIRDDNAKAIKEAAEEEKSVAAEVGKIKKEIVQQTETDISNAKAGFRKDDLEKELETAEQLRDFRDRILEEELDYIDMVGEMRDLKNKETLNKLLKNEKDAKKREELIRLAAEQETADKIANIRNKIQALDDAEAQMLDENGKLKVGIKQEEYDAVLLARQRLKTELSDIENQETKNVKKNADEQLAARKKSFEDALNVIKDFTDVFFDALNVANERQEARYDEALERSQQRQDRLQEEIDNSTGLRRRFFEEQLETEIANAQKLEQAKEELAKKAAKQQKAQAILQSIINTALAVSAAYFTPPAPNIPAAVIAGILGAAQTGIIAAQPLARGGVVGMGDEVVQFANGGKVTSGGNIKPLSNGDNVLATLKTGEVVLNQSQQKRIGYRALKAAKIPNFATGGLVGAPSGFLTDQLNSISEEANRLNVMQNLIIETQNRIDRLQVVYTASTEDQVDKARNERKEIRVTAQI